MRITALVNGKEMELEVKKQYNNGMQEVYECVTVDGVWVAVEESTIVSKAVKGIKTRFDYEGGECRTAIVTIKAATEEEAEAAHEILEGIAAEEGYSLNNCDRPEYNGKHWVFVESIGVEYPEDAKFVNKYVYKKFKMAVK